MRQLTYKDYTPIKETPKPIMNMINLYLGSFLLSDYTNGVIKSIMSVPENYADEIGGILLTSGYCDTYCIESKLCRAT